MPVRLSSISKVEQDQLLTHLRKHIIYPYTKKISVLLDAANLPYDAGGGTVFYARGTWTPTVTVGIVSIAVNFIVTPNTTVDIFGLGISYKDTFSILPTAGAGLTGPLPDDEGGVIYQLLSNGGAINDLQEFYPLDWYLEKNQPIYIYLLCGAATRTAGTSTMLGEIVFGTLQGGI